MPSQDGEVGGLQEDRVPLGFSRGLLLVLRGRMEHRVHTAGGQVMGDDVMNADGE